MVMNGLKDAPWVRAGLPVAAVIAGLAVQSAYILHLSKRLWFFGDDWEFLTHRVHEGSLFAPHNEHWVTVPILAFRAVFAVVGIDSYQPYAALPIVAHCVIWIGMYLLLRRIGVADWPAAGAVWVGSFLAAGVGAENTLWDFQVGFLGSAAFGVLAVLFLQRDGWRATAWAWASLVLALASSGIGLIFLGWAGLNSMLRDGFRRALVVGVVPTLVYGLWYLLEGRHFNPYLPTDITAFPLRMAEGINAVWSEALGMRGAGAAVLLGLTIVAVRAATRQSFALAFSGIVALFAAFALFGYSRSGLGEGAGTAPRYLYFGIVLTGPAVALAVSAAAQRLRIHPLATPVALVVVAAFTAAMGLANLNHFADKRAEVAGGLEPRVAAAFRLATDGSRLAYGAPSPTYNPNITVDLLRAHPAFGKHLRTVSVSEQDLLDARAQLQVSVAPDAPAALPAPRTVRWHGLGSETQNIAMSECRSETVGEDTYLEFAVPTSGGSITLKTQNNQEIRTSLRDGDRKSEKVSWKVDPRGSVVVTATASGLRLRIHVPPGRVKVCPPGV